MIYKIILFAAIVFTISCKDTANDAEHNARAKEKTPVDSVYEEVDKAHIVGMKRMGDLRKALAQIQQELDSLVKLPHEKMDAMYQQSLIELQEDLNYADYSMNTWMTEFKADTLQDNPDARMKYLQAEKIKAEKMRDNILNGLQRADSVLKR